MYNAKSSKRDKISYIMVIYIALFFKIANVFMKCFFSVRNCVDNFRSEKLTIKLSLRYRLFWDLNYVCFINSKISNMLMLRKDLVRGYTIFLFKKIDINFWVFFFFKTIICKSDLQKIEKMQEIKKLLLWGVQYTFGNLYNF